MSAICQVVGGHRNFGAVQALNGVDLEVESGEILGIVGPNGSGKTTLFNCMTGLLRFTKGNAWWLGREITRWPMHRIARSGLVRTFQHSMFFPSTTVRGNLMMAAAIAEVGRGGKESAGMPHDVDTLLDLTELRHLEDIEATALTHGQLRQLGVAVALAARPRLLLLDEPAAGLNDAESDQLGGLLRRVREAGVTLAVVDHDMGFVTPLVDRMVVLCAGKVLAQGPPAAVLKDPAVIEVYLGARFAPQRLGGKPDGGRSEASSA